MKSISELLRGGIDLHIHSGPGLVPRTVDHIDAAKDCINAGMRALVIKDHYSTTADLIYFFNKYILKDAPISIFGGLVLNNHCGGLSPIVVDTAIRFGAKIIWMPTLSAKNHIEFHKKETSFHSTHEKKEVENAPLTILNDEGQILPEVIEICRLIAEGDIILATGHIYLNEINLLVDEAKKQGVKKILINHPEFIINATIDEMKQLALRGAFIEHSYTLTYSNKLTKEYLFEMIRKVGAEHTIIGSDLGQVGRPKPVDGLKNFIQDMLDLGMKDEEIDLVLRRNPARLLSLV